MVWGGQPPLHDLSNAQDKAHNGQEQSALFRRHLVVVVVSSKSVETRM